MAYAETHFIDGTKPLIWCAVVEETSQHIVEKCENTAYFNEMQDTLPQDAIKWIDDLNHNI